MREYLASFLIKDDALLHHTLLLSQQHAVTRLYSMDTLRIARHLSVRMNDSTVPSVFRFFCFFILFYFV